MTITIFIDADACPVKEETYKVASRHGLPTFVVSDSFMQIPLSPLIARVIVGAGSRRRGRSGEITAGPLPSSSANRSQFLQALDQTIPRARRRRLRAERRFHRRRPCWTISSDEAGSTFGPFRSTNIRLPRQRARL